MKIEYRVYIWSVLRDEWIWSVDFESEEKAVAYINQCSRGEYKIDKIYNTL